MSKIICICILVLCALPSKAQFEKPFKSGEKVVFDAYYNWGFIWLHAGQANFSAKDTMHNNIGVYKLQATGSTFPGYDKLFKVRDTLSTFVSRDSLKPLFFKRQTNEGNYTAHITYRFDYTHQLIYGLKNRKGKLKHATFIMPENTHDMLSVIYYLREINTEKLKKNDKIRFNMVVDNELWELYVRYLGKKTVKLKSGRKFNCLVLSPLLLEGSVFSGGEGMKIFVTDDKNRLPIYIESKVLVGKVKASMIETHNLKYPLSSEIF